MTFEQNIKKWVEYDTLLKRYNESIKDLREKRSLIEENIHNEISNREKKPVINISDGTLKFGKATVQQPLSYKLIEQSLQHILSDKKDVDKIINAIKSSRISKECNVIKRFYN